MRDKDLIIAFVREHEVAGRHGIVRYMYEEHGTEPHTTRCYLWQLVNDDMALEQDGERYLLAGEGEYTGGDWI